MKAVQPAYIVVKDKDDGERLYLHITGSDSTDWVNCRERASIFVCNPDFDDENGVVKAICIRVLVKEFLGACRTDADFEHMMYCIAADYEWSHGGGPNMSDMEGYIEELCKVMSARFPIMGVPYNAHAETT